MRTARPRWYAPGSWPRPDPTPADGPDPYGSREPAWLDVDWRRHLRTAELDEARVNYVDLGDGPGRTIVFVHGLSGSWQNWLENIPHFAPGHRVVALDLPGFGASPMPAWELTIPNYGRLVHDFCEKLGVERCCMVGNSMGGFVAAEAAITDQETRIDRIAELVLVSAAGVSSSRLRGEPVEVGARMLAATAPLLLRLEEHALRRPLLRRAAFQSVFHRPLELRAELLYEFFHHGTGKSGFIPALANLTGYDFLERLERLDVPTLIVWGRNDRLVPPGDALEFARRIANSRVAIFDRCGHCPQAERPLRFNRTLEEFLDV